jgi:hypothetical protein
LLLKILLKKGCIDYKKTFSPVSRKDSFKIIMTLLAHYDIELHQMTVKTIFQNRNLDEKVYMDQEGFLVEENKI